MALPLQCIGAEKRSQSSAVASSLCGFQLNSLVSKVHRRIAFFCSCPFIVDGDAEGAVVE